MLGHISDIS